MPTHRLAPRPSHHHPAAAPRHHEGPRRIGWVHQTRRCPGPRLQESQAPSSALSTRYSACKMRVPCRCPLPRPLISQRRQAWRQVSAHSFCHRGAVFASPSPSSDRSSHGHGSGLALQPHLGPCLLLSAALWRPRQRLLPPARQWPLAPRAVPLAHHLAWSRHPRLRLLQQLQA